MEGLVVDSFAGGGGASLGIAAALGREPDFAINHNAEALALHAANHPKTIHLTEDVWKVKPTALAQGRPVALLWMSPDCRHFSKAKGAAPVSPRVRGLAWVALRWAKSVRPKVIILENVQEFEEWGPLTRDGKPCPRRKGQTFADFVAKLERQGYRVERKRLKAYRYGSPTIRERLFVVARCDGLPIVWPEGNFDDPKSAAVASGQRQPWRTAADIIDWSLPCPSIFETAEAIFAKHGVRAKRPLEEATLARVAKGVKRYVLDTATPFIVGVGGRMGQSGERPVTSPAQTVTSKADASLVQPFLASITHQGGERTEPLTEPMRTVTAANRGEKALIAPAMAIFRGASAGSDITEPAPTVTANSFLKRPGGAAPIGLLAPVLGYAQHGGANRSADAPMHTVTASAKDQNQIIAPYLVPRYGERPGQEPRSMPIDQPAPTVVPTGNGGSLAAVHLSRQFGRSIGSPSHEPSPTVMPGGQGKVQTVAAFLAQNNTGLVGHDPRAPISTIVGKGCTQSLVEAAFVSNFYSSSPAGGEGDPALPLKTVTAEGGHQARVGAALAAYYGSEQDGQAVDTPLRSATSLPRFAITDVIGELPPLREEQKAKARAVADLLRRFGCWDEREFVTVGDFIIVDLGLRMLVPRELASAQGFPASYILDIEFNGRPLSRSKQTRMIGNSVCPQVAEALVRANVAEAGRLRPVATYRPWGGALKQRLIERARMAEPVPTLFDVAA